MAAASSSELRQRKGNAAPKDAGEIVRLFQKKMTEAMEEKVRGEAAGDVGEEELQERVDEALGKLFDPKKKPLPGLNHETKAAKDALADDPYSLELIFVLGEAYMQEEKYVEATNVLLRGWKRMNEMDEPQNRFAFLFQLCLASFKTEKYKQAYAVLMDIEEPAEDDEFLRDYLRLSIKVYANNGQLQKSLKAFHRAIESLAFDQALPVYMDTFQSLRKVGAFDAAKSALEQLAESDSDKDKMKVVETVSEMKAALHGQDPHERNRWTAREFMPVAIAMVIFVFLGYMLWIVENRSLKSLKLVK